MKFGVREMAVLISGNPISSEEEVSNLADEDLDISDIISLLEEEEGEK